MASSDSTIVQIFDTGKNPNGIRGFPDSVRGMYVAVFTMAILYMLLMLLKFLVNLIWKYEPGFGVDVEAHNWRGSKKQSKLWRRGDMANITPPPPPAAGVTDNQPPGNQNPVYPKDWAGDWDQGVESEKGYPGEITMSRRLSRAADVTRLGFILLLGAATTNAFSFDSSTGNPLGWLFFSLVVIWAMIAFVTPSRWVPLVMGLISFPIVIAMFSVAFEISSGPLQTS